MHILLVGAGAMAIEYSKVLDDLKVNYTVLGRGEESARVFEKETGKKIIKGGLESKYEEIRENPTHAIITSTLESLESNAIFVLKKGIKNVLIEKPGAVNPAGLESIEALSNMMGSRTFIGYNRRFYSSVLKAEELIEEDGGLSSFIFEFTELSHKIEKIKKTEFQLNNWFIGNSTHVLDTAFYFGGKPKEFSSFISGGIHWHPHASVYVGAGVTEKEIPFSYHANWSAPGSWKLELLTKKNRYIFRPFEKLHVQRLGSFEINEIDIDDKLDIAYKPGLYGQVNAFLYSYHSNRLLSVQESYQMMKCYFKMNGDQ